MRPNLGFPDALNASIMRALTLRCIGQATTMTAGEEMTVAGIQLCDAAATAPPISGIFRA